MTPQYFFLNNPPSGLAGFFMRAGKGYQVIWGSNTGNIQMSEIDPKTMASLIRGFSSRAPDWKPCTESEFLFFGRNAPSPGWTPEIVDAITSADERQHEIFAVADFVPPANKIFPWVSRGSILF